MSRSNTAKLGEEGREDEISCNLHFSAQGSQIWPVSL